MTAGPRDRIGPVLSVVKRSLPLVVVALCAPAACTSKPFVLDGNASYARVTYSGDMESATAAAKRHCAPFERVPQFREIEENTAYFECVKH